MKPLLTALAGLALFLLIGCILGGEKVSGRGSEVENELGVYGVLVDEAGKPVPGAKVKAQPAAVGVGKRSASGPAADSDSVVTDAKGRYSFRKLGEGAYDLFGDKSGDLVVLVPDVVVEDTGKPVRVGTDTLRAPGRIRGRVLSGSVGKPAVLCYIPGTSYLAASGDSGGFTLTGVPQGRYRVSYSATGFLIASDSGVLVRAGQTTILPDKQLEHDPALPPPAPIGLKAAYDTLNEQVTLSWKSVPVSDLEGYVVYRDDPSFLDPKPVGDGFTTMTTFVDATAGGLPEGVRRNLVYRVKARDLGANLSVSFSTPAYVTAVSRSFATTVLSAIAIGTQGGAVSVGDSLSFVVHYANPSRAIRAVDWYISGTLASLRQGAGSGSAGADTLRWEATLPGQFIVTAQVRDDAGTVWSADAAVQVLQDPPKADAGRDTTVSIGDGVRLQGSASDYFGKIGSMAWDIDATGTFKPATDGRAIFTAPAKPGMLLCVFRAVDDDGNASLDTAMVAVVEDPPRVSAGIDTQVTIKDTVRLSANGQDGFGTIIAWQWTCDGGILANSATASWVAPGTASNGIRCIARATDDDGMAGSDTLVIKVTLSPPQADAGADTLVTMNDLIRLRGRGTDNGSIVKYEWDIGAKGIFVPVASGDTTVKGPSILGAISVYVLRVTDDDGLQDLDTVSAKVYSDPPKVDAGKDMGMQGAGTLSLHGVATDPGKVVSKAWDIGSKGSFFPTATGDTAVSLNLKIGDQIPCVFRAVDDDGEIALDTVWIRGQLEWIELGTATYMLSWPTSPIVSFKGEMWSAWLADSADQYISIFHSQNGLQWSKIPTTISRREGPLLKPMFGKLWLIGGRAIQKPGFPTPADPGDTWVSSDGMAWTTAPNPSWFGSYCAIADFKGGIVVETGLGSFIHSIDGVSWNPLPGFTTGDLSVCHSLLSDGASLWNFTSTITTSFNAIGIWKYSDATQWIHLTDDAPFAKLFYFKPFLLEGKPAVITVDPDELHAWHSLDGGVTWTKLPGAVPHYNNTTIKVVECQGKIWLFVHTGGELPVRVFKSQ